MKALEKDRERRYESANAFAADVQRYLHDEPVLACPPSSWYRLGKYVRRNKPVLGTAGLLLLFIVSLGIGAGWVVRDRAAREQEMARDRSAREAALNEEAARAVSAAQSLIHEGNWPEALALIQRTEKLMLTAGRQPEEMPAAVQGLDRDLAMARRLEEIHSQPGRQDPHPAEQVRARLLADHGSRSVIVVESIFNEPEVAKNYARAFRDYGIDLAVLPVREAAERIRGRSIWLELTRALDFWSSMCRRAGNLGSPDWKQLLDIAMAADEDPWRARLRSALQRGDRRALELLAASTEVASLHPVTLHLVGSALYDVGATEQAVSLLRVAQRHNPGDLWLNVALGWVCHSGLRQYDESLRFYSVASALRPLNPYMVFCKGRALQDKGDYAEAIIELTRAIELGPEFAEAWWQRAWAHRRRGQYDKAVVDYSRVIELKPTFVRAWINRGWTYQALGQPEKTIADSTEAIKLDPKNAIALNYRGSAHALLGHWEKALADCAQSVELEPENAGMLNGLAWWLATATDSKFCDPDRAIKHAKKATELAPKSGDCWNTLGVAYYRAGDWKSALAALEKSMEFRKGGTGFDWFFLAMAHARLGDKEKARQWYARATHWMEKNKTHDADLLRVRAEATHVLGVQTNVD
jgi:tetratricopeptide (TPR) repeat protein